jgi:hypothetical protein
MASSLDTLSFQKTSKNDEEISADDDDRYEIDKDIVGNVKLIIKKADKAAEGKYACRIVGREKEKNCFTKSEFVLKGTRGGCTLHCTPSAWSMLLSS